MRRSTVLIRLAVAVLLLAAAVYRVPAAQSAECMEGLYKRVRTGPICSCEGGTSTPMDWLKCVNGVWEYQYSFCDAPFCLGGGGGGGGECSPESPSSCPYEHYPVEYYCPSWCSCCY
jgi:hypothetical protein